MPSRLEFVGIAVGAVVVGTAYVLVHEARRKRKKAEKAAREAPISKEMLLKILNKSAEASKAVIERIRVEVHKIQQQRNLSDEQALKIFQDNFEHSLDQLIGAIRKQYKVSEKAMDASFKQNQSDPEVQQAIQNMRLLSAGGAKPAASAPEGASSGSSNEPLGANGLPESLTKDRLKEIMTFNAVMLEKELRPIKEQVERIKQSGQQAQLDPQLLMQVQLRISSALQTKFGVTDEQVMKAVEVYGAKNDSSFKPILQKIATTLSSSLG